MVSTASVPTGLCTYITLTTVRCTSVLSNTLDPNQAVHPLISIRVYKRANNPPSAWLPFESDTCSANVSSRLLCARPIQRRSIDWTTLPDWTRHCQSNYCANCEPPLLGMTKLKVIDCTTHQIVDLPSRSPYVALNYVGGKNAETNLNLWMRSCRASSKVLRALSRARSRSETAICGSLDNALIKGLPVNIDRSREWMRSSAALQSPLSMPMGPVYQE